MQFKAYILVLSLWAVIFLPGLGTPEFKGEEGRRVLPAVTMVQTGNWIMPSVGGEDYYNKPPGINWLVAASFLVTGGHSEWAARLPSVLGVLAFVTMLCWIRTPWLGWEARLIGAIVFMTNISMIEKGRLIEIEAVYVCLTGLVTLWWLAVWSRGGSPWAMWVGPCALLVFGALVKGPLLGVVFYVTVLSVLLYARRIKAAFSPAHMVGIVIILVVCLGWVYLAYWQTSGGVMVNKWAVQWHHRVAPKQVNFTNWGEGPLRGLVNMLPWLLMTPLLWMRRFTSRIPVEHLGGFRACRLAMVVSFVAMNLMPGTESRYSMPVIPLVAILLGWILSLHTEPIWTDRLWRGAVLIFLIAASAIGIAGAIKMADGIECWLVAAGALGVTGVVLWLAPAIVGGLRLSVATSSVTAILVLEYAVFALPIVTAVQNRRPAAAAVNAMVPSGQTVYVYRPGYQPFLFYVRQPLAYLVKPEDIDGRVRYLLLGGDFLAAPEVKARLGDRQIRTLCEFELSERVRGRYRLIEVGAAPHFIRDS
ncbi:MAG: glycosyltransferase family 39 protein [Planctomycetes bacterium]|nr:glycosyltransferase family 39 protein [Planctomycetota bacterium]